MVETFGSYLKSLRLSRGITQRGLAKALYISAPYVSDMERGNRNPPNLDILEPLTKYLKLDKEEKLKLYDLAGTGRGKLAPDIAEYIKEHDYVAQAIRASKRYNASKEDWERFIKSIEEKQKNQKREPWFIEETPEL